MKNIAFKKSLYKGVKEGSLNINLEKRIKREEKLYTRTKFKRKVNRVLISKVEHLGTSGRYQKLDLKNYVSTDFYKKKVLNSLTSIVGKLYKKQVLKTTLKKKPLWVKLDGVVTHFLSKIVSRLNSSGGPRYFFKKTQKDKNFLKVTRCLKVKNNKPNYISYGAPQIKKRKMYTMKKPKERGLARRIFMKLKFIEAKRLSNPYKLTRVGDKQKVKSYF